MSDKSEWWVDKRKPNLHTFIFSQMVTGAGWAALVLAVVILIYAFLRVISGLLPDDPYAALDTVDYLKTAIA